jgi:hypothetical protein
MYKLFSRLLNARMESILDQAQSVDQAGFISGFGVDDHLFTAGMLNEGRAEFSVPRWACTVDFRKAFDTVDHRSLWAALAEQGVPSIYIRTLAKLYENQIGRAVADRISKPFQIQRGTEARSKVTL